MNEEMIQEKQNDDELVIDFSQLLLLLKKNLKLIIITTFLCAALMSVFTIFFVGKKYESEERIYLTPKVNENGLVDSTSVSSNNMLVNNYVSMLKGENILTKVAKKLNIENVDEIKGSLTVTNETNTQIISVVAKTDDPVKSRDIVKNTVNIFFNEMKDKMDIKNLTIIDSPKVNEEPVSPNKKLNLVIGAFIGIVLSCGYVFLKYLFDKRLKNRSEAESFLGLPVLAEIPWYEE